MVRLLLNERVVFVCVDPRIPSRTHHESDSEARQGRSGHCNAKEGRQLELRRRTPSSSTFASCTLCDGHVNFWLRLCSRHPVMCSVAAPHSCCPLLVVAQTGTPSADGERQSHCAGLLPATGLARCLSPPSLDIGCCVLQVFLCRELGSGFISIVCESKTDSLAGVKRIALDKAAKKRGFGEEFVFEDFYLVLHAGGGTGGRGASNAGSGSGSISGSGSFSAASYPASPTGSAAKAPSTTPSSLALAPAAASPTSTSTAASTPSASSPSPANMAAELADSVTVHSLLPSNSSAASPTAATAPAPAGAAAATGGTSSGSGSTSSSVPAPTSRTVELELVYRSTAPALKPPVVISRGAPSTTIVTSYAGAAQSPSSPPVTYSVPNSPLTAAASAAASASPIPPSALSSPLSSPAASAPLPPSVSLSAPSAGAGTGRSHPIGTRAVSMALGSANAKEMCESCRLPLLGTVACGMQLNESRFLWRFAFALILSSVACGR
jgi:hypothetical protein